jgi:2'-5' RNA ligase
MRLFAALNIPESVSAALEEFELPATRGVRRVPRHQMHVTVRFIGDAGLGEVRQALQSLECKPCRVLVRGVGRFITGSARTILWAGVSRSRDLLELHAACGRALADAGVRLERRRFVPHVTLARLQASADDAFVGDFMRAYDEHEFGSFVARRFVLYDSMMNDSGPRYEALASYMLE